MITRQLAPVHQNTNTTRLVEPHARNPEQNSSNHNILARTCTPVALRCDGAAARRCALRAHVCALCVYNIMTLRRRRRRRHRCRPCTTRTAALHDDDRRPHAAYPIRTRPPYMYNICVRPFACCGLPMCQQHTQPPIGNQTYYIRVRTHLKRDASCNPKRTAAAPEHMRCGTSKQFTQSLARNG